MTTAEHNAHIRHLIALLETPPAADIIVVQVRFSQALWAYWVAQCHREGADPWEALRGLVAPTDVPIRYEAVNERGVPYAR